MGYAGIKKRKPCLSPSLELSSRDPPVSTAALELQTLAGLLQARVGGELKHFSERATPLALLFSLTTPTTGSSSVMAATGLPCALQAPHRPARYLRTPVPSQAPLALLLPQGPGENCSFYPKPERIGLVRPVSLSAAYFCLHACISQDAPCLPPSASILHGCGHL